MLWCCSGDQFQRFHMTVIWWHDSTFFCYCTAVLLLYYFYHDCLHDYNSTAAGWMRGGEPRWSSREHRMLYMLNILSHLLHSASQRTAWALTHMFLHNIHCFLVKWRDECCYFTTNWLFCVIGCSWFTQPVILHAFALMFWTNPYFIPSPTLPYFTSP